MEILPDWNALTLEMEQASRRLLEQARDGDWEGVVAGEEARRDLIERLFARPVPPDAAPRVAEGVQRVLELDRELADLARRNRDDLGRRLGGLQRGRQARNAYGAC